MWTLQCGHWNIVTVCFRHLFYFHSLIIDGRRPWLENYKINSLKKSIQGTSWSTCDCCRMSSRRAAIPLIYAVNSVLQCLFAVCLPVSGGDWCWQQLRHRLEIHFSECKFGYGVGRFSEKAWKASMRSMCRKTSLSGRPYAHLAVVESWLRISWRNYTGIQIVETMNANTTAYDRS
jgi:hypothetical protein